jgi:hypothetical protein
MPFLYDFLAYLVFLNNDYFLIILGMFNLLIYEVSVIYL